MVTHNIIGNSSNSDKVIKPILKWAGGKGQLLEQIAKYLPQELIEGKIDGSPVLGVRMIWMLIASTQGCH